MSICVCIEGQLRGSKNCGPTIKKYLVEKNNADLYFCLQNYEKHNDDNLKYYGLYKQYKIYNNPIPDFSNTFDDLCSKFNYEKKWISNFEKILNYNWKLGYDRPGTCIRRMYNRYLIYEMLKDKQYDWFVLLRSDLFFINDFYDISAFDTSKLYCYEKGGWGGVNNNLIVFHKNIFEKVLTYIKNFLNLSFLNFLNDNLDLNNVYLNEEVFFMYNMKLNQIDFSFIPTVWFISGDEGDVNTWDFPLRKDVNGYFYKYDYDYNDAMNIIDKI